MAPREDHHCLRLRNLRSETTQESEQSEHSSPPPNFRSSIASVDAPLRDLNDSKGPRAGLLLLRHPRSYYYERPVWSGMGPIVKRPLVAGSGGSQLNCRQSIGYDSS